MRPRWTEARDARLSRHRLRQTTEEDRQGPAEAHEERSTCVRRFRTDLPRGFLHIRAARISADLRAEYVAQIQDFRDTLHQCFWNRETARTLTDRGKEDVAARAARPANRTPPTRRTRPRHRNAGSSEAEPPPGYQTASCRSGTARQYHRPSSHSPRSRTQSGPTTHPLLSPRGSRRAPRLTQTMVRPVPRWAGSRIRRAPTTALASRAGGLVSHQVRNRCGRQAQAQGLSTADGAVPAHLWQLPHMRQGGQA